jgi:hypothetical protein
VNHSQRDLDLESLDALAAGSLGRTVVTLTRVTNMTGLRTWDLGWSFFTASHKALRRISGWKSRDFDSFFMGLNS